MRKGNRSSREARHQTPGSGAGRLVGYTLEFGDDFEMQRRAGPRNGEEPALGAHVPGQAAHCQSLWSVPWESLE